MENLFFQLLEELSYFGVILLLTFEFIPGELILPLMGYMVYQGKMNLYLVTLAGAVGGTTGALTLYALGKYGGRPFLMKFGKYFLIRTKQIERAERFFEKHGGIVAFTARFIPGIRTLISIPCGLAKMNIWLFCIYTFIAMLPITFFYVFVGYQLGPKWKEVGSLTEHPVFIIVIFVLLLIVSWYVLFRKKSFEALTLEEFSRTRKKK